ncbi:MAG: hypothetical protein IJ515_04420 [Clostridia bacterium]|nr:hypothetical protein [Clostridia bacterium]
MNADLMEPLRYYETVAKKQHEDNARAHFEDLLARSGVDEQQNTVTVNKYHAQLAKNEKLGKKISRFKFLRVMMIITAVVGAIMALVCFNSTEMELAPKLIFGFLGIALLVSMLVLIFVKINRVIKSFHSTLEKEEAIARELLAEATAQVAPLLALFDDNDTLTLMEKTLPEIKFDRFWSHPRRDQLISDYSYTDIESEDISVIDTLSGEAMGNPFFFERYLHQDWGTKTYHGSLQIHWVSVERDSKGNTRTVHRTQTLHASVAKPIPVYETKTLLHYGHQAAPDLSFSRQPTHSERLGEKALNRKVKSGEKKLAKKAREALTDNDETTNFTEMGNSEFDVLFGALNRDHEVQFRVLFTPLAQRNMIDLMRSGSGYGDDFYFTKWNKHNIIASEHAANWCMDTSVASYASYGVGLIRDKFISFNNDFFKSVYFDLAPLLAIPAYHEEPAKSLEDYNDNHSTNYTSKEHEALANRIGRRAFAHPSSDTEVILKTSGVRSDNGTDTVTVTAHSFNGIERMDYVSVYGGDGRWHNVPVPWVEYIPVQKSTQMSVKGVNMSESSYERENGALPEGASCFHGLLALASVLGNVR